jgi:aminoglycoside phosphotransferase (APT) family kinase protein
MPTPDRAGLNLAALPAWLTSHGLADATGSEVRWLPGGTQNVMLQVATGRGSFVLRAGPNRGEPTAGLVARETTVLLALAGTPVPHPTLVAVEPDASVLGRPFYLMQRVDGTSPVGAPRESRPVPSASAVAEALLRLAELDPDAVGLEEFGHRDGWLSRQVRRWQRQLASYCEVAGYPGHGLPHTGEVARWLNQRLPEPGPTGLLHGDLHLGNLLFSEDGRTVSAIVDWELATLGDPLLDLAELAVTWPDSRGCSILGAVASVPAHPDLPGPADILRRYRDGSARDLTELRWYLILACFRLGVLLEGSRARAFAGTADWATASKLHAAAVRLLNRAAGLRTASSELLDI